MEVFTNEEVSALKEFRAKVTDILNPDPDPGKDCELLRSDEYLIRWLRARDLDVDKAEDLFRKSVKWREEKKVDSILDKGLDPELKVTFPFFYDGVDKEGRVVVTLAMGEWDIRESVEKDGPEKFTHYTHQMLETVRKRVEELHKKSLASNNKPRALRYLIICDYEGFSMRQLANMKSVNTILQIVGTYEAHYPETMHMAYIINAPTIFSILFGLMKPLMTARTINKIQVFNSDRDKWEPVVLKAVEPSQIRSRFGGTKE